MNNYIFKEIIFPNENIKFEDLIVEKIIFNENEHLGDGKLSFDYEGKNISGKKILIELTKSSNWKIGKKGSKELGEFERLKNEGLPLTEELLEGDSIENIIDNIILAIRKKNSKAYLSNSNYQLKLLIIEIPFMAGMFMMMINPTISPIENINKYYEKISTSLKDEQIKFNNIFLRLYPNTLKESYFDIRNNELYDGDTLLPDLREEINIQRHNFEKNIIFTNYQILKKSSLEIISKKIFICQRQKFTNKKMKFYLNFWKEQKNYIMEDNYEMIMKLEKIYDDNKNKLNDELKKIIKEEYETIKNLSKISKEIYENNL